MYKTSSFSIESIIFTLVVYMFPISGHKKQSDWIYILLWTYTPDHSRFYSDLETGREAFTSRNCSFQNCYITKNRTYLNNVVDYDVLIFNAFQIAHIPGGVYEIPKNRKINQIYVLASADPAAYNTINDHFNVIFNLTWTYKLNSDIVNPYFIIKNNIDEIVGPTVNSSWVSIADLPPVNRSVLQKLKNKRIAAVWVESNCLTKGTVYALKLKKELMFKYGLQLDIFGKCGNRTACKKLSTYSRGYLTNCYDQIESDYYFYLAFENSLSEDYVSEKVLHGLDHFTVPIVYGGADYKRFLPDEIYLDAIKLGVEGLAKEMHDIINDPPRYYDFFKWHGYYSFHDAIADNYSYTICELCAFLNNKTRKPHNKNVSVYENIANWWNSPNSKRIPYRPESLTDLYSSHRIRTETSFTVFDSIQEPMDIEPKPEPEPAPNASFGTMMLNSISNMFNNML